MTDRDHFAAFVHQDTAKVWQDFGVRMGELLAEMMDKRISDAMLGERGTAVSDNCAEPSPASVGSQVVPIHLLDRMRYYREENRRLKDAIRRLADQDATLSVRNGNVTVTVDGTLTETEREAIQTAAMLYEQGAKQMGHVEDGKRAVALRAMLERLG